MSFNQVKINNYRHEVDRAQPCSLIYSRWLFERFTGSFPNFVFQFITQVWVGNFAHR